MVQFVAYILNRSPTRANTKRASPLEVLTGKVPKLREIVVFGSLCSVYRDPRKNSLKHRAQVGTVFEISEEIKGYKVYLRKENKVIITQHVKNIETLSIKQNEQLCQGKTDVDRSLLAGTTASDVATMSQGEKKDATTFAKEPEAMDEVCIRYAEGVKTCRGS